MSFLPIQGILQSLTRPMGVGLGMPGYGHGMGMGMGAGLMPQQPFRQNYRAFPVAAANKDRLEAGDKIILPPSAFDYLARLQVQYPMLFRLKANTSHHFTHCGVMEFSSEEGVCYLPYWMMQNLLLETGGIVEVSNIKLDKGNYVKLQPHSTDFTRLHNPRVVLEKALRNFSCLTKGDTIAIQHGAETYYLDVVEVRPGTAVSVIETDVNVDFAPPKDAKEEEAKANTAEAFHFSQHDQHSGQVVQKGDFAAAKPVTSASAASAVAASSSLSAASGDAASSGDYFSKLGSGYKLKTGKKEEAKPANLAPKSANSSPAVPPLSSSKTPSPAPSPGLSPAVLPAGGVTSSTQKRTVKETVGRFEYIYEVEGDRKRLVRRIALPQSTPTPASAGSASGKIESTSAGGAASSLPSSSSSSSSSTSKPPSVFASKGHSLKH